MKKKVSKYNGWLVSEEFHERALAVFGYSIIGQLFVFIIILGIWAVFALLIWILSLLI
ncbi:hypothetical protein HNV12_02260 [Methanococcoides sp. SA1]|nr:hypothetical protein [Methanococcoides sp. SA1]